MSLRPLAPQASASANFATSAGGTATPNYFLGATGAGGVEGAGVCGVTPIFGFVSSFFVPFTSSEVFPPASRVAKIDNDIEVTMNTIAETVVALLSNVADPRGPNAVCEPWPPKAPAKSAAFPLCSSTTTIKNRHTKTCTIVNRMITTSPVYTAKDTLHVWLPHNRPLPRTN